MSHQNQNATVMVYEYIHIKEIQVGLHCYILILNQHIHIELTSSGLTKKFSRLHKRLFFSRLKSRPVTLHAAHNPLYM